MKVVIIEDEKLTAKDLQHTLLAVNPEVELVAMLSSVEDALEFFREDIRVDLIFSDIQLGDGLSFEIFEQLDLKTPIIYCTAFDQYALKAFKTFGVDYILKPFSRETVAQALEKFTGLKEALNNDAPPYAALIAALKNKDQSPPQKTAVIIQRGDKIIPLPVADIALFYIEHDSVHAYSFSGKKHALSETLNQLEEEFSPDFFRVNRQFLVHRKAVRDASQYFHRKLLVNLTVPFEEQILVGKLKVTAFLSWLANN
jgi:two-component system response regulator LytT